MIKYGQWLNEYFGLNIPLDKHGDIVHRNCTIQQHRLITKLRWEYIKKFSPDKYSSRGDIISVALNTLKNEGIKAELVCFQNAHIHAYSKNGMKYSYYAGTGTIAGFGDNSGGLDHLISLCKI